MFSILQGGAMTELRRGIWFRRTSFGIWPAHWKGWALFFSVFPVWLAWTLICAVTGLIVHPFVILGPVAAYIVWLFIYMDRHAANRQE